MRFPVLVELPTGAVTCFRGRVIMGGAYASELKRVVNEFVVPAVGSSV